MRCGCDEVWVYKVCIVHVWAGEEGVKVHLCALCLCNVHVAIL